jgi:hypothetical protein
MHYIYPEYDFHVQKVLEVSPYLNLCTSKALKEPNVQEKKTRSVRRDVPTDIVVRSGPSKPGWDRVHMSTTNAGSTTSGS